MAQTRDFKETVAARIKRDPAFREALLREALIAGEDSGPATPFDFKAFIAQKTM